ncbi:hypothetical protein [Streptomyces avermitilis]|uniref:hypothetical protein n=1 Tax=Streptomyces avermitilis TaxID=33903 RepID=UPI0038268F42
MTARRFDYNSVPVPARRRSVRYADPVAWLVLDVLTRALPDPGPDRSTLGVIAVTEHATGESLRSVAQEAAEGRVSPLHFVAASPGTVIGLSCAQLGITGPTMLLTMAASASLGIARELAEVWLADQEPACPAVAVVGHETTPDGHSITFELIDESSARETGPE